MTSITLLREGLCIEGLILVLLAGVAVILLAACLDTISSPVHDDSIHNLGTKARKAIDHARREYLDRVYIEQFHKEDQNEQLR